MRKITMMLTAMMAVTAVTPINYMTAGAEAAENSVIGDLMPVRVEG